MRLLPEPSIAKDLAVAFARVGADTEGTPKELNENTRCLALPSAGVMLA